MPAYRARYIKDIEEKNAVVARDVQSRSTQQTFASVGSSRGKDQAKITEIDEVINVVQFNFPLSRFSFADVPQKLSWCLAEAVLPTGQVAGCRQIFVLLRPLTTCLAVLRILIFVGCNGVAFVPSLLRSTGSKPKAV